MKRPEQRLQIPAKEKKLIIAKSASRCSFPGCNQLLMLDDGSFFGQLSHIEAISPGGPRYNPRSESAFTHENLILLCPNHHHIIDREPHIYTTAWLKKARNDHYLRVERALKKHDIEPVDPDIEANLSFKEVF
jgi:hypothetical protein